MREIALLIAANLASQAPDRRADAHLFDVQLDILRKGLAPNGFELTPVRWVESGVDWARYAAVMVNCAWDYQDRHDDFLATLDRIAALGVPVFNDPATVRWNIRKTYLREIEAKGVPVIPTLWPEAPTADDITHAMEVFGSDDVIIKRQVGGGARGQTRYTRANLPAPGSILDRPGMIQPFIPPSPPKANTPSSSSTAISATRWSSARSPATTASRRPMAASSQAIDPTPADRAAAQLVLDVLDTPPLYARVDMVRGADGRLLLMELEVLEPYLFPKDGPQIGAMLGAALKRRLG